jgi:hypothetical protein
MIEILVSFIAVVSGLIGLMMTILGKTLPAGILKVVSIIGLSILGIINFNTPIIISGFLLAIVAEMMLSLLNPILKKDILFYIGFISYIFAYILIGSTVFTSPIIYLISALIIALVLIPIQIKFLDKADKVTKIALGCHMTAISILLVSAYMINWVAVIGVLLIYLCDSIIGHSKYNSKYKLDNGITESIITISFTLGMFLYVISRG